VLRRGYREKPGDQPMAFVRLLVPFLQDQGLFGEIPWSGRTGIAALAEWFADEEGLELPPMNRLAHALSRVAKKRIKKVGNKWPTVYVIPKPKRSAA